MRFLSPKWVFLYSHLHKVSGMEDNTGLERRCFDPMQPQEQHETGTCHLVGCSEGTAHNEKFKS